MRYLILAGLLVAAAPVAAAEICDQPIAKLNLEQIEFCQTLRRVLHASEENFREVIRRQQAEEGCVNGHKTVIVGQRGREPEIVETAAGCR